MAGKSMYVVECDLTPCKSHAYFGTWEKAKDAGWIFLSVSEDKCLDSVVCPACAYTIAARHAKNAQKEH